MVKSEIYFTFVLRVFKSKNNIVKEEINKDDSKKYVYHLNNKNVDENTTNRLSKENLEKLFVLYDNNHVNAKELSRSQIYELMDYYDDKIETVKMQIELKKEKILKDV